MQDRLTFCMTMGRRPDLLDQTLQSLTGLAEMPVRAVNDFGDEATNDIFRSYFPQGTLLCPDARLGHHKAVDWLYGEVKTPYIFHNEDDWLFSRTDFLEDAIALLEADATIASVCFRDTEDFGFDEGERRAISNHDLNGIRYRRLDALHDQWHGYTFNPHVARRDLWAGLNGFSGFGKERHISRTLRARGLYVAFLMPPACCHIGEGRSTAPRPVGPLKRLVQWMRQ